MSKREFKKPPAKHGKRLLAPEIPPTDDLPPAFGFYGTMPEFGLSDLAPEDLIAFMEAVRRRSQMTWSQMWANDHTKLGIERLPQSAIRVLRPAWLTHDHVLIVIRCGGFRRMVGVRNGRIFEAIWLDCTGQAYDHGS